MKLTHSGAKSALTRSVAASLAVLALVQFQLAQGAPAEAFTIAAPAMGSDPPKAHDVADGDSSVSTQTGALNYSYPITVPPGRNGMAPHLSLTYSSQAPIYGTIATGWALSIPEILQDTSQGTLRSHAPQIEVTQADPRTDDGFVSTMAGGRYLVKVTEPKGSDAYAAYRAQNDSSFYRYERMPLAAPYRWRVSGTDGTVMFFGDTSLTAGCNRISEGNAPLTRTQDAFGNTVQYHWGPGYTDECRLNSVSWGASTSGNQDFAQLVLTYQSAQLCQGMPIGAQQDFRTGVSIVRGASAVSSLTATAFAPGLPGSPSHTRQVTLSYNAPESSCTGNHAPFRQLASIQESAWHTSSDLATLPAVTFQYGTVTPTFTAATDTSPPWGGTDFAIVSGKKYATGDRWPTVDAMLVDLDGDGLLDRLVNNKYDSGVCSATWLHNNGLGRPFSLGGPTATAGQITLPRLKWHRATTGDGDDPGASAPDPDDAEGCALNGMWTTFRNSHIAGSASCVASDNYVCHPAADASDSTQYCGVAGRECRGLGGPGADAYRTYLAYRWLDIDGDGLTDLVAAVHGSVRAYDIEAGNGIGAVTPSPEPPPFGVTWPTCPGKLDRCATPVAACVSASRTSSLGQLITYDWTALNSCFASAPTTPCQTVLTDNKPQTKFARPTDPGAGGSTAARQPYTRCEGLYPWFVFKNTGNGQFATTPTVKYQPIPLESDTGDSNISGPAIATQFQALEDFDGDGILDIVARPHHPDPAITANLPYWFVWLGDGQGGVGGKRYVFPTRDALPAQNSDNFVTGFGTASAAGLSSGGTQDLNGDGLPDHWMVQTSSLTSTNANMSFSNGLSFRLISTGAYTPPNGERDTPTTPVAVKPGTDAYMVGQHFAGATPTGGYTMTSTRVTDMDSDGRPDVLVVDRGGPRSSTLFNLGGQFLATASPVIRTPVGAKRYTKVLTAPQVSPQDIWEVWSDLVDFDGDGMTESLCKNGIYDDVNQTGTGCPAPFAREYQPIAGMPPRLLTTITNGRGATTTVSYASMHEAAVVTQDPAKTWNDSGRPQSTPSTQWVVSGVTTAEQFSGTTSSTRYEYATPRHGVDDRGKYGFRGFGQVKAFLPSGSVTISRFSYDQLFSGLPTAELVQTSSATTDVSSVNRTSFVARTLFSGALTSFHVQFSEHVTCFPGQAESACLENNAANASGYVRTEKVQTPLVSSSSSDSTPLLWVETESIVKSGFANADGDRHVMTAWYLFSDGETYRLRPTLATSESRVAPAWTTFAKSGTTWDASWRFPIEKLVYTDATSVSRGRTTFDPSTGNATATYKPNQANVSDPGVVVTYDDRKLFVVSSRNQLGHVVQFVNDYGTGSRTITLGPNTADCTVNCLGPTDQQHVTYIDGLGRSVAEWETVGNDDHSGSGQYTLRKMSSTTRVDSSTATTPCSVTQRNYLNNAAWESTVSIDGLGRTISETTLAQGTAAADHVVVNHYANSGDLTSVETPDPSVNSAARVTYRYGYDSLHRMTSFRRPDGNGADVVYSGLDTRTSEFTSSGAAATTATVHDRLGRLTNVQELRQSPAVYSATRYTYQPDDSIKDVVDPEGVTTTMKSDWAGRRTEVARSGRTWNYVYDPDGNVTSEQVPGSTGPVDVPNYVTTTQYDVLDRPVSRVIGQRALNATDQTYFGSASESYSYDQGFNMLGRLRTYRSFGSGSVVPAVKVDYFSDAQGRQTDVSQTLVIAGLPAKTRTIQQSYTVFGGPLTTQYNDGFDKLSELTASTQLYDAIGRPSAIRLSRGAVTTTIAQQSRNSAGLVISRSSPLSVGTVTSAVTYDFLGRLTGQKVTKTTTPTAVASQTLSYTGNDDISQLITSTGSTSRELNYYYDVRHQLTHARAPDGLLSATYAYGPAGRFVSAYESQTLAPIPVGSEVVARDVTYAYGGSDPEQVTSLGLTSGGLFSSYTYDASGNQTSRCYGGVTAACPGAKTSYTYDGSDHLRRVGKATGATNQGSEEYWYDGAGSRLASVTRSPTGITGLTWFIGGVEALYTPTGTLSKVTSHISAGTPVARVVRTGSTTTSVEYLFNGLSGNTLAIVPTTGSASSFVFAPFGRILESSGPAASAQKYRLNGKYVDPLSELGYYGARYYDNVSLQWTQADPVYVRIPDMAASSTPRRASVYTFSLQNPNRYLDPDGLDTKGPGLTQMQLEGDSMQAWYLGNMHRSSGYQSFSCANFSDACPKPSGSLGASRGHSLINFDPKWRGTVLDLPIANEIGRWFTPPTYPGAPEPPIEYEEVGLALAVGWSGAGAILSAIEGAGAGAVVGAAGVAGTATASGASQAEPEAAQLASNIVQGTNYNMFQQAVQNLQNAGPASMVSNSSMFQRDATAITRLSGNTWNAAKAVMQDGAHLFTGETHSLICRPDGAVFYGSNATVFGVSGVPWDILKQVK